MDQKNIKSVGLSLSSQDQADAFVLQNLILRSRIYTMSYLAISVLLFWQRLDVFNG
jgi:hypothetical protein